jgi:hypothetical protein
MLHTGGRFFSERYDCVVVGSGPAGMSLALALASAKRRILLLESGHEGADTTGLANAIGYGHYPGGYWNAHWSRTLGGTSSVWSGWCTPLRDIDFDNPAVGVRWPISRSDLLPYWLKAAPILDHNPSFIDFEAPLYPGFLYRPIPVAGPTRFATKYLDRLNGSAGIDVGLECSAVGLEANESRSLVTRVDYVHHPTDEKRELTLRPSQSIVLAAGGIGNAQLFLQPRPGGGVPVGNESGLAGKFLMEHPHFLSAGECAIDAELDRIWPSANPGQGVHAVVASREFSLEHGLYGCSLGCSRKTADQPMARYLTSELGRSFYHYDIAARAEMRPSPSNEVFLTGERDRSGLYRPGVRCVIDASDLTNVERTLRLFGESLIRTGKGRVRVNNDRIYKQMAGGGHIMGTTRMGQSPLASVVDRDCRVHGYDNLFVAGSSVFPSAGYANPTLTIVALALRLADRLAETR